MIRKYQEDDTEAIIEVWFTASRVATPFLSETFLNEERDTIRKVWLPTAETWVFEAAGKIEGFLSLIGNEVGAIFVRPDRQGKGIGRALMDHAASLHDELFLDVFEDNVIGRRFYDRYGFRFERRHLHEQTGHMQLRLVYRPDEQTTKND